MRALKLISAVALVMAVTGTAGAVTINNLPAGWDYLKSRNEDMGSAYVVDGLADGHTFAFDPTGLPGDFSGHVVSGLLDGVAASMTVHKVGAVGAIGREDSWGIALLYQISSGQVNQPPGTPGTIVGFKGTPGIIYDNSAGDKSTWYTAMFYGGVDTWVVQTAGNGANGIPVGQQSQTVSTANMKVDLYAVDASAIDGALVGAAKDSVNLADYVSASRTAADKYVGWTGNTIGGTLLVSGVNDYHQSTVVVDASGNILSNSKDATTAYFTINPGGYWNGVNPATGLPYLDSNALIPPTGLPADDLWFQWTLDTGQRGWTVHSDDIGGAFNSVPEPLTMLGVFLGVGGMGGYLRRRSKAVA